ncbi:MAG: hypothetical protein JWP03_384 [Phycisphaerales bacterium]|nr:hypothetical protein [Phycisphaerales bacterium]
MCDVHQTRPLARTGPWIMGMRWHDLLFMHWPVPIAAMRELIPPGLEIDTFEGEAWIGVVPFRMSGVRPRFVPPIPRLSAFPELNVRTYVKAGGRPGVWFFSLDAASRLAVRAARVAFHLPYFDAAMSADARGGSIHYSSTRTHRNAPPASLRVRYQPTGDPYGSTPGHLDDFLTNRLCLYAADARGRVSRGDIAHAPWPLQPAEAEIEAIAMTEQIGIKLPQIPPVLHFAKYLDVLAWLPTRV